MGKKIFKNDIRDKASLTGNFVKSIIKDKSNNLWIGTGKGLSKYNLVLYKVVGVKC